MDVKTGEEEEETLFEMRSKLFVFGETLLDKGTGNKTWRERGVGTVKLLKHREFGKIRTLMRQDKVRMRRGTKRRVEWFWYTS